MFSLPRLFSRSSTSNEQRVVDIPAVEVVDIEKLTDKESRTTKHLIRANHKNHSLIYNDLKSYNELVPFLGAAYLLGANDEHLEKIFDEDSTKLEEWKESPNEVGGPDWFTFLGRKEYQRAFVDFFEDQLINHEYNWKELIQVFLYEKTHALFNGLVGGFGSPLLHLAYAYKLSNREAAIEALALLASVYDFTLDDGLAGSQLAQPSSSPRTLLRNIRSDSRFEGLFTQPGAANFSRLMELRKADVIDYVQALNWDSPQEQIKECFQLGVSLLVTSGKPFDSLLCRILTSLLAVRTLLPIIRPTKQLRPEIQPEAIGKIDTKGKNWEDIVRLATSGKHSLDASYVQALRAMKEAGALFNDNWYLKAALYFTDNFDGWRK